MYYSTAVYIWLCCWIVTLTCRNEPKLPSDQLVCKSTKSNKVSLSASVNFDKSSIPFTDGKRVGNNLVGLVQCGLSFHVPPPSLHCLLDRFSPRRKLLFRRMTSRSMEGFQHASLWTSDWFRKLCCNYWLNMYICETKQEKLLHNM